MSDITLTTKEYVDNTTSGLIGRDEFTAVENRIGAVESGKQDKLEAGWGINITENNVIFAEPQKYTYISENNGGNYNIILGKVNDGSMGNYAKWVMMGAGVGGQTAIGLQTGNTINDPSKIIINAGAGGTTSITLATNGVSSMSTGGTISLKLGNLELDIDQAKLRKLKELLEA